MCVDAGTSRNTHETMRLPASGPASRSRTEPTRQVPSSSTVKPAAVHVSGGSAITMAVDGRCPHAPTVPLQLP